MNNEREYTSEELVNINKTFNGKGAKMLNIPSVVFTLGDMNLIQEWASNRYTNFNGGFGIAPGSEYALKYKVDNKQEFTFASDKQLREDIAGYGISQNYIFNERNFIERLNWLELLIIICQNENIEFEYNRSIIDKILSIKS